jgi:hypothetical protein
MEFVDKEYKDGDSYHLFDGKNRLFRVIATSEKVKIGLKGNKNCKLFNVRTGKFIDQVEAKPKADK